MDEMLADLERDVVRRATLIDAPAHLLPTYVVSEDLARPHIEREGDSYCFVVKERGVELERRSTTSLDEILYWIFEPVTFSMASDWELANRVEGEDSRRGLFTKQLELLDRLDPIWASRYRLETAKWLAEVGL